MPDWTDKLAAREVGEEDGFHGHDESLADIPDDEEPVITAVAEPAPKAETTTHKSAARKATTARKATKATAARKR
jgi:hypothetical protein